MIGSRQPNDFLDFVELCWKITVLIKIRNCRDVIYGFRMNNLFSRCFIKGIQVTVYTEGWFPDLGEKGIAIIGPSRVLSVPENQSRS